MVPVRLVSIIFDHSASSSSSVGTFFVIPAAFTRMSTLPNVCDHRIVQPLDRSAVQHVARHAQRAPAQRFNLRGHRIHLFLPPRTRHHVRARRGKSQRNLAPQAGRPAGHHRDPPAQIKKLLPLQSFLPPTARRSLSTLAAATLAHPVQFSNTPSLNDLASVAVPRHTLTDRSNASVR